MYVLKCGLCYFFETPSQNEIIDLLLTV